MRATYSTAIIAARTWLVSCGRQAPVSAGIILTNGRIFTCRTAGFVEALAVPGELVLGGHHPRNQYRGDRSNRSMPST